MNGLPVCYASFEIRLYRTDECCFGVGAAAVAARAVSQFKGDDRKTRKFVCIGRCGNEFFFANASSRKCLSSPDAPICQKRNERRVRKWGRKKLRHKSTCSACACESGRCESLTLHISICSAAQPPDGERDRAKLCHLIRRSISSQRCLTNVSSIHPPCLCFTATPPING